MGNVFKSNEIYKRLKNVSAENNPLRRVRGVYVVGYLKIPKYTVSGILISSVKNIPATVIDMYDTYKTTYSDTLGPAVYDITPPSFTVERLTYANINTTPDSTLRIRSIISNYATISTI